MTMSNYNNDEHPVPSGSSKTQELQQSETTISLSGLDIPSSDLDLDSIIAPSQANPEQWAELDSQF